MGSYKTHFVRIISTKFLFIAAHQIINCRFKIFFSY